MKLFIASALLLLLANSQKSSAESCSGSHAFDGLPITLDYALSYDEATSGSSVAFEVVYEGLGWVSWALSADGTMTNSLAVIGLPDDGTVDTYLLSGKAVNMVSPTTDTEIVLSDSSIAQNDTHTVLTFTASNAAPFDTLEINPMGLNIFLVAGGSGNSLGYHQYRGGDGFTLTPCGAVSPVAATATAAAVTTNATAVTTTTTATEATNTTVEFANATDVTADTADTNTTDGSSEAGEMEHDETDDHDDDDDHDHDHDHDEDGSHMTEDESTSGAMYYTSGAVVAMFSILVLQVAL